MNKRIKKKIEKKKFENIPVGFGIVIGGYGILSNKGYHNFPVGTLVKINSGLFDYINCVNLKDGLSQSVNREDIVMNIGGKQR